MIASMLDIQRLRLLQTLVATGSIRASASALGYSPSAVSQQLALLQRETKLRLVERVGRGVELTAAGYALAAASEAVFEELGRLEGVIDSLCAGRLGRLSIGYFSSVGAAWLPQVVHVLRTEFPNLHLDLRMVPFTKGERDIEIFVEDGDVERSPNVEVHRLVDDRYVVVVRADDPLARTSEVPLSELVERTWIDNDHPDIPCRRIMLTACARAGFAPKFAVETPDYQTAFSFVAKGFGVTVIPELAAGDLPEDLTAVLLSCPNLVRHISVAVRNSIADHPAVLRVLETLTASAHLYVSSNNSRRLDNR